MSGKKGSYWPYLLVSLCASAAANLIMRGAMSRMGPAAPAEIVLLMVGSPALWLGMLLWATGFLLWLRVLATEEISHVYPVVVGLSFLVILYGSSVLFGETSPAGAHVGTLLVVAGIAICSWERRGAGGEP